MQSAFLQGVTHSQLSEVETIDPLPFPVLGLSLLERKKKKKTDLELQSSQEWAKKNNTSGNASARGDREANQIICT